MIAASTPPNPRTTSESVDFIGVSGKRHKIRSLVLYPAELRALWMRKPSNSGLSLQ
jgi:hypothetical protein